MSIPIFRSLLFVPANNWRMLLNSLNTEADAIVIDMEDAVPIDDKETARWFVKDFLIDEVGSPRNKSILVRINSVSSGLYKEDLEFIIHKNLDGIVIPKTESREDIQNIVNILMELEGSRGLTDKKIYIIPLIESARGVENAPDIVKSSDRIIALSFGAGDYLRDLGLSYNGLSKEEYELIYPRSRIVVSAVSRGVYALDTPFLGLIIDREGLKRQCIIAKRLGFKGKYAIHPRHIKIINSIFSPTIDEISEAREIVKIYEEASKKGLGVTSYKGRMIDYMNYKQAKAILDQAKLLGMLKGVNNE